MSARNYFFKIIIFFLPLLITSQIFPKENIVFDKISSSLGLSHSTVTCFGQDSKGYIWIGTIKGLNRYDGFNIETFKNIPGDPTSISGNYIKVIYNDRDGNLWIGTKNNGLNKYIPDKKKFIRYLHDPVNNDSINSNNITSIIEDDRDFLWVGTDGGGLNKFNKRSGSFSSYHKKGKAFNSITRILFDQKDKILWVGSKNSGLGRIDIQNNTFKIYKNKKNEKFSISDDHISSLLLDKKSELWIGTDNGYLNRYSKKDNKFFKTINLSTDKEQSYRVNISDIIENEEGIFWIGTRENGVIKYDQKKEKSDYIKHKSSDRDSISSNRIMALFKGEDGLLWIGTDRSGICIHDKLYRQFSSLSNSTNKSFNKRNGFIEVLLEDSENNLWVGYDNGLEKLNLISGKNKSYNSKLIPGIEKTLWITALFEDHNKDVWIGTKLHGLFRYIKKTGKIINFKNNPEKNRSLSDNYVTSIIRDRSGILWVATWEGYLNKFNDTLNEFERYAPDTGKNNKLKYISTLTEDDNIIWIGTKNNGLIRYDKKNNSYKFFKNIINNSSSLSNNTINDIHVDSDNDLWIATSNGVINKLDKGKQVFKRYTDNGYFKDDQIFSIIEDRSKFLWFITDKRVIKFDPEKIRYYYFDKSYWMKDNEILNNSGILSKRGELMFGGTAGITFFDPDDLTVQDTIPRIHFTSVLLGEDPIPFIKTDPVTGIKTLRLPYDKNSLTFIFELTDYRIPYNSRYKYIFEGIDPKWTVSEPMDYVQYDEIDPGDYTFRIKGANHYGIWNNKGDVIKIIISTPFWLTLWFKILTGLLFLGILYSGFYLRNLRQKKLTLKLEKKVNSRTSELNKKQEELKTAKNLLEKRVDERTRELKEKNTDMSAAVKELNAEIIERNRTEEALYNSEEKFRSIFEETKETIFFSTPNGEVIDINPSGLRMLGFESIDELKKTNLQDLCKDQHDYEKLKNELEKNSFVKNFEYVMKKKNGDEITVIETSNVIRDLHHNIVEYRGILRDVTERRNKEKELRNAKESAESANQSKNEFLANISHEIRTPLNAIQGFSELIIEDKPKLKINNYAAFILTESEHLLELINELLDVSKVESGKFELENFPFDLERLIESVNGSMHMRSKRKKINYSCEIKEDTTFRLTGDPNRLRQILVNLIGNAIKFTSKGSVRVTCKQIQDSGRTVKLHFSIKDTGIGIPKNKQDVIFESFVQADGSNTRKFGGTGLGTTIAKQLIELMDGEIGLESEEGKGSTFWFTVNINKRYITSKEEDLDLKPFTDKVIQSSFSPIQNKLKNEGKILLVEDYTANQEIAITHLTNAGYTVELANNGKEATQLVEKSKFDLILMDIQMPVMDGFQATEHIKSGKSPNTGTPIIALTGNVFKGDLDKCFNAGMQDVIAKPFRKGPFLMTVGKWINPEEINSEKIEPDPQNKIKEKVKKLNEPLDYKKVIYEFEGDKDLVNTLITDFLEDIKQQIAILRKALDEKDTNTIGAIAHKIKGGAGNLTADLLSNAARDLEELCSAGNIKKVKKALNIMVRESEKLGDFFGKIISEK